MTPNFEEMFRLADFVANLKGYYGIPTFQQSTNTLGIKLISKDIAKWEEVPFSKLRVQYDMLDHSKHLFAALNTWKGEKYSACFPTFNRNKKGKELYIGAICLKPGVAQHRDIYGSDLGFDHTGRIMPAKENFFRTLDKYKTEHWSNVELAFPTFNKTLDEKGIKYGVQTIKTGIYQLDFPKAFSNMHNWKFNKVSFSPVQIKNILENFLEGYKFVENCGRISEEEKTNLDKALQRKLIITYCTRADAIASAQLNGRKILINKEYFFGMYGKNDRNRQGTLFHEAMHLAGYDHVDNPLDERYKESACSRVAMCIPGRWE